MHTNINIVDVDHIFKYVVDYGVDDGLYESNYKYSNHINHIVCYNEDMKYCRDENVWVKLEDDGVNTYIPKTIKKSTITLYYPQYSAEVYHRGVKYAMSLYTWIHGKKIVLGEFVFERQDSLAVDRVKTFGENSYYECSKFSIVDPYDMCYSDSWKDFREKVCGEPTKTNSVGSVLYISLHIVEGDDELKLGECYGGQNSIQLGSNINDYLNLSATLDIDNRKVDCKLNFNDYYEGDLKEYLMETYGLNDYKVKYELIVKDKENVYKMIVPEVTDDPSKILKFRHTHYNAYDSFSKDEFAFENWSGYKEGLEIICSAEIMTQDCTDTILCLLSNSIPLTQDVFKYFVEGEFIANQQEKLKVNLDNVKMKLYNISAVNKIENKVVQLNRVGDNKSNIIQSIFYRVNDAANIIIHPAVTETICINLDQYKSMVDTFALQLEGYVFQEVGRTTAGVLFKIAGSKLPKTTTQGTYYILNQDLDMVTSGKYSYVQ